jgi:hypothetical protein
MFRFKRIIGSRLRSRTFDGQRIETEIGINILNRMTLLGTPNSEAIRT